MHILIPTIGSRGDAQPFIALAQALIAHGHRLTLASHPVMRNLVESHHLPFAPIGPDIDLSQEVAAILQKATHPAAGLMQVMRFSFRILEQAHPDILTLCRQADLVVVPASSAAGKNEADLLDIPYLSVTLMPWAIPWDDPARPLHKRLAYGLFDSFAHLITTRPLNRMRRRLGLPPVGKEGFTSLRLNLIPVSPAVFPPILHWEPRHKMVGYWFVQELSGWQPPVDLQAFLEAGPPPIAISLGSMSLGEKDPMGMIRQFSDAIQRAGLRAVIQGWPPGMQPADLPASIFPAGPLPHSWLLPRCQAVIHHGGFGTTSAGLRAGIPALVIPHLADQFYWGDRIHALGVGPPPIRRANLTAQNLVTGMQALQTDTNFRTTSANLGEQIRTEHGLEKAVRLIEETFS